MKKAVLFVALSFTGVVLGPKLFAGGYEHTWTDGYRNGFSFGEPEAFDQHNQYGYVQGVADALRKRELIHTGDMTVVEVYDRVQKYYSEHPHDKYKPIVDVLLEEFGK